MFSLYFSQSVFFIIRIMPAITSSLPGILWWMYSNQPPALMRSVQTLAQSVSTLLIITHDCCDLVPAARQLELHFSTISYSVMAWGRKGRGERREMEMVGNKRMWGRKEAGENERVCINSAAFCDLFVQVTIMRSRLRWIQITTWNHLKFLVFLPSGLLLLLVR